MATAQWRRRRVWWWRWRCWRQRLRWQPQQQRRQQTLKATHMPRSWCICVFVRWLVVAPSAVQWNCIVHSECIKVNPVSIFNHKRLVIKSFLLHHNYIAPEVISCKSYATHLRIKLPKHSARYQPFYNRQFFLPVILTTSRYIGNSVAKLGRFQPNLVGLTFFGRLGG